MDRQGFKVFVDGLVRKVEPGSVLNYFRTKRLYAKRRFYRVRVESLAGNTTVKGVREEFAKTWLILGAGEAPGSHKIPLYTACLKMGDLPARQFRALKGDKGVFSLDLRGCVGWAEGDKPIVDTIKKYKGLRMTEEQKAKRFIECVLARAHCSEEEAMELWASTKTATLSKLRRKKTKK